MKTTTKFWKLLPVAAAALALGGCGGGGSDDSDTSSSGGSIVDCFTAKNTVNFMMTESDQPSQIFRSTTGPMTYNGQAVTGQIVFYPNGIVNTDSSYWTITSNGVTMIATVYNNDDVIPDGTFFPKNMAPGQAATDSKGNVATFIGFETTSLAGKTFSNTCHFKGIDPDGYSAETWYAPGYGLIKQVESSVSLQYNGDL